MRDGVVFNVQRYSIHDGPGIRTTVFLKGCPLRCSWCHNPESQAREEELSLNASRCVGCGECQRACPEAAADQAAGHREGEARCIRCGACAAVCPTEARQMVGRRVTVEEVLAEVLRDRIFYDESGGGVTFSGGEPFMQPRFLLGLLRGCRAEGVHTAVDTSGFTPREELLAAAPLVDLFLYDLKMIDDERHRRATGVSSLQILDNLKALGDAHERIWIRVPVVPGFNDDDDALDAIARFARSVKGARQVQLLPYHRTGRGKVARLDRAVPWEGPEPPSAAFMDSVARRFRAIGVETVTVA